MPHFKLKLVWCASDLGIEYFFELFSLNYNAMEDCLADHDSKNTHYLIKWFLF